MSTPRPRRRLFARILTGILYLAFCAVAVTAGALVGWVNQSKVLSAIGSQLVRRTDPQEVFQNKSALNLLVLGCDEDRAPGGKKILKQNARSDMMMLARLDFTNSRISGVSIPRDTVVSLPGYRQMKINGYYAIGGKEMSRRAVEELLGVKVDRVVVLNYKAFQEMVDIVGGVELFVPKKLKYTDRRGGLFIDLKAGKQLLDGYKAMGFVRYRHGDSDFERQKRQREFLLAFKDSVMKRPELLGKVADKARDVLGNELSADEVAALALFARRVGNDNIKVAQIPVVEAGGTNLAPDYTGMRRVLREQYFIAGGPETARVVR